MEPKTVTCSHVLAHQWCTGFRTTACSETTCPPRRAYGEEQLVENFVFEHCDLVSQE